MSELSISFSGVCCPKCGALAVVKRTWRSYEMGVLHGRNDIPYMDFQYIVLACCDAVIGRWIARDEYGRRMYYPSSMSTEDIEREREGERHEYNRMPEEIVRQVVKAFQERIDMEFLK